MTKCGCLAGTFENGWKEVRSKECIRKEIASWGLVRAWMLNGDIVKTLRKG